MNKTIHYGLMLSDAELDYLSENKYGINRMKVLRSLIEAAVMEATLYEKKGFSVTLKAGQAILSEVELATRLGYDKKTVSRLIDQFNRMGIVSSMQGNRTSIHELHCLAAWYVDGKEIRNPCYVSRNKPNAKPCVDAESSQAQHEGRGNHFPAIDECQLSASRNHIAATSEAEPKKDSRGSGITASDKTVCSTAEPMAVEVNPNSQSSSVGDLTAGEI